MNPLGALMPPMALASVPMTLDAPPTGAAPSLEKPLKLLIRPGAEGAEGALKDLARAEFLMTGALNCLARTRSADAASIPAGARGA